MQDLVPIGTGNSRYLKSVSNFKTLYPTYDSFAAALVAGTLPVDFNGINEAGISQKGTALNKATLLTDAVAAKFGFSSAAVPNDVFSRIRSLFDTKTEFEILSYVGTGTAGKNNPTSVTFSKAPGLIIMLGYRAVADGRWYQTQDLDYDYFYMLPTSAIPTAYTRGMGFGGERNHYIYGKKSAGGKTFSWYSWDPSKGDGTAAEQCNASGCEYYVLGLSTGATSVSGGSGGNGGGDSGGSGSGDSGTTTDTVTITIDGYGTITVEAGTTWLEYIAADGAGSGFYIDSHDDAVRLDDWYVIDHDGNTAWSDSEIVQGIYYLSEEMEGGE